MSMFVWELYDVSTEGKLDHILACSHVSLQFRVSFGSFIIFQASEPEYSQGVILIEIIWRALLLIVYCVYGLSFIALEIYRLIGILKILRVGITVYIFLEFFPLYPSGLFKELSYSIPI